MIKKEALLKLLNEYPEDIPVEDLIDRLILLEKIQKGLEQVENGQTVSHEAARERLSKWLK